MLHSCFLVAYGLPRRVDLAHYEEIAIVLVNVMGGWKNYPSSLGVFNEILYRQHEK